MKKYIIISFIILTVTLTAEEPFWEYLYGPEGGYSYCIKENNKNDIFVCTKNGVYRSSGEFCSWEWILEGGRITHCAISKKGKIFITRIVDSLGGPHNKKEFLCSEDDGKTWEIVDNNMIPFPRKMFFDNNDILFALNVDSDIVEITYSEDLGETWIKNGYNFNSNGRLNIYHLFILNKDTIAISGRLFDGQDSWGVIFISNDRGKSWIELSMILYYGIYDLYQNIINEYIARTDNGIIISSDGGSTWNYTLEEENLRLVLPINDRKIFVAGHNGLYLSNDYGHNWTKLSNIFINNLFVNDDGTIYASSYDGLYISNDMGITWQNCYREISAHQILDFGIDRLGNVYSVISTGILIKSPKNKHFDFFRPFNNSYKNLEVSKRNNLYVTYRRDDKGNGVCYTTDQGRTWDTLTMDFPRLSINKIKVDDNENIFLATYPYSILRTTDMGQTWDRFADSVSWGFECIEFNSEGHWFIGTGIFDLYRSTDEGKTWVRQINQDHGFGLTEIVFHPTNGLGYAGGSLWLYRTINNGRNWQKVGAWTIDLALDSAGYFYTGLARFKEDLSSSEPLKPGYMPIHYPKLIEYSPTGYIYSAAEYGGLYRSREPVVSVVEPPQTDTPKQTILLQNSPNPFTNLTEIQYFLSKQAKANLKLLDMNGRIIAELIGKYVKGGWHHIIVNGSGLTNGSYLLRLESEGKAVSKIIHKVN